MHAELSPRIVVEPCEAAAYRAAWPDVDLLVLAKDDQGLPYARNAALADARRRGLTWYWMLDDDITAFRHPSQEVSPVQALLSVQGLAAWWPDLAQLALTEARKVRPDDPPVVWNGECSVCVAIRVLPGTRWDEQMLLKGDLDYTLRLLTQGYPVARSTVYTVETARHGTNAGGQQERYAAGEDAAYAARLAARWSMICDFTPPRVCIHWERLATPDW